MSQAHKLHIFMVLVTGPVDNDQLAGRWWLEMAQAGRGGLVPRTMWAPGERIQVKRPAVSRFHIPAWPGLMAMPASCCQLFHQAATPPHVEGLPTAAAAAAAASRLLALLLLLLLLLLHYCCFCCCCCCTTAAGL